MDHREDMTFNSTFQNSQSTFSPEQMNRLMSILKEHNRLNMMLLSEGYRPILMQPTPSLSPSPSAYLESEPNLPLSVSRPISSTKRIPRPNNSFMTYRKDKQKAILDAHPGINNKEVSKIVGEMWRNESEDIKEHYRKKAEQGKKEHALRYPGYKYTPRKRQRRAPFPEEFASPQQVRADFLPFANAGDNYLQLQNYCGNNTIMRKPNRQSPMETNSWDLSARSSVPNFLSHPAAAHNTSLIESVPGCHRECWGAADSLLSPHEESLDHSTGNLSDQENLYNFFPCYINAVNPGEITSQMNTQPGTKGSIPVVQSDILYNLGSKRPQEPFDSYEINPLSLPQSPLLTDLSDEHKASIFEANIQQFEKYLNEVLGPRGTRD